ncbi:MAG TPA: UDP-N-acetylglucosamine diphosphorylase/glucosamine-1-phosphate N-acetyltransferase [Nitrospirae bacterium]|nr:UDP-N-acetylglucosamine diphosphorylase/glucosamine-1-phosphate N-acetyltransferase [Nitrospirota bacterium]
MAPSKAKRDGKAGKETKLACIILAAGHGTRMKSLHAKVLHPIYGRPMLDYVLETAVELKPARTIVVVNRQFDTKDFPLPEGARYAIQKEQKGTANAVSAGVSALNRSYRSSRSFKGTTLVLNGDTPLVTHGTLKRFLRLHKKNKNKLSVLSFNAYDPTGYGRILRDEDGRAIAIVEEKDATEDEQDICEVNSGVYALEHAALPLLKSIKKNRKKGEYYLTDIVELASEKKLQAGVFCQGDEDEFLGINSRLDLARAHEALRLLKIKELLEKGVTLIDPASTYVSPLVVVAKDTCIYPNVFLHGNTKIGKGCTIYPNVRIIDSTIRDGAVIRDSCLIEESIVGKEAEVGPMAHLRPLTQLGNRAKVGNFVETKRSTIGEGSKAMHLSYIGDATLGANVNIGAGCITCNYDGKAKHHTRIDDGVFIGSGSQLVAPVNIGKGSYVGAGSTITSDVPEGSLSVSRSKQKTLKGWADKKAAKPSKKIKKKK